MSKELLEKEVVLNKLAELDVVDDVYFAIDKLPTAYDVDKVVA